MPILELNAEETAVITAMDQPLENCFGAGVNLPGGSPAVIPAIQGYTSLRTDDPRMGDQKTLTKNAFRAPFSAFISALKSAFSYTTVTEYGTDWRAWGDPAYSGGVLRYWKDVFGTVRVTGLVKSPSAPVADDIICTLPAGYRPAADDALIFACAHNTAFACIQVSPNGSILFNGTPTADGWVSLNFSFKAG